MKLHIEKPVYGGDCLARLSAAQGSAKSAGKKVFVPLTLPGETVEAFLIEDKRAFARAELESVLTASSDRAEPQCPHFGVCGGCQYQHANYSAQLAIKRTILRETLDRAKVSAPAEIQTLAGSEDQSWQYRNRIRLALRRGEEGHWQIGYRARRSHEVAPIRECPIAAPNLIATALQIAGKLSESPAPCVFSEVELFTSHDQSALLVTLFCTAPPQTSDAETIEPWLNRLFTAISPQVTGMRAELDDGSLQPQILAACGETSLTYEVAGLGYQVPQGAFFQVNRNLLDRFAALVTSNLTGSLAWDLYAGVGLFARRLTQSFAMVHAVEIAPASTGALQHNLAGSNSHAVAATTLDYLRCNREQREPRPDVILLDPPRAGLGDEVTHLLNAIGAPQLVYVSCDPATLARDLHALTRERYRIETIHLADMFPQTFHLESVVRLRRA